MSRRYGRNQKRAARARIAELAAALITEGAARNHAESRMRNAEYRAANAREQAFEQYARVHGLLETMTARIGEELGRALGPKLYPHAADLMAKRNQASGLAYSPNLKAEIVPEYSVIRITGSLPSLHYRVEIAHMDFAMYEERRA